MVLAIKLIKNLYNFFQNKHKRFWKSSFKKEGYTCLKSKGCGTTLKKITNTSGIYFSAKLIHLRQNVYLLISAVIFNCCNILYILQYKIQVHHFLNNSRGNQVFYAPTWGGEALSFCFSVIPSVLPSVRAYARPSVTQC